MDQRTSKVQKAHGLLAKSERLSVLLYNRIGEKRDIHRSQHMVLMYLSKPEATGSQKEIAEVFEISPPAVAMLLKRLEKNGFVKREMSKTDNRCNIIRLTKKGMAFVEATQEISDECNELAFGSFTDEELDTMIRLLEKVQSNIKEHLEGTEEA